MSPEEARSLRGLLFDLDDTFLDHGRLIELAYGSLCRLSAAGWRLLVVTGRPAAWADVLARQWPVHGVISENGALLSRREGRGVRRHDFAARARPERRRRLLQLVRQLEHEFPDLSAADDVGGRLSDFTFDIGERERVAPERVDAVMAAARRRGAHTTRSSVHLHVSFDAADKASGSIAALELLFGEDATRARVHHAYIGDSENDAPCFAAFRTSIGVSNLSGRLSLPPRYVTELERSAGFAEAAEILLARADFAKRPIP